MAELPFNFALNTGAQIPALGLGLFLMQEPLLYAVLHLITGIMCAGTWQSRPGEVRAAVKHALEAGYRHIDAAYCYGNEEKVGLGLQDAIATMGIKREDVFITTKLWCTYHTRVAENLDKT